jgi:hypothetical protein
MKPSWMKYYKKGWFPAETKENHVALNAKCATFRSDTAAQNLCLLSTFWSPSKSVK